MQTPEEKIEASTFRATARMGIETSDLETQSQSNIA